MEKKRMSNKVFLAIWIPILLFVTALIIAANIIAVGMDSFFDHYFGGNPYEIVKAEGTEDWDTEYYSQTYKGEGSTDEEKMNDAKAQAKTAAERFVTKIAEEGIVLLKNDNDALPVSPAAGTIALMGRYSADPVYGGSGSGNVDASSAVNFKRGLENAGFTVNSEFYNETSSKMSGYAKANIVMDNPTTSTYYIGEIPLSAYSDGAKQSVSGQTAVVVLGRGGGEGGDLARNLKGTMTGTGMSANNETANYVDGQHQLELTTEEKDLISFAKASCSKVIVVINSSATMELGLLESGEFAVDAIMVCGSIGSTGANAIGKILSGEVNPSGKTVDTWAADFTLDPTFENFGEYKYTNIDGYYGRNGGAYFVEYEEGIYVGYRYYETAAEEGYIDYDEAVVYPFGYGLSYTTFDRSFDSVSVSNNNIVAKVKITNTGNMAGKDVPEIYFSAPYNDGDVQKSAVVLGGFAKTKQLVAGESQTLEIEFPVRDMASYSSATQSYVLDEGDYVISLQSDSHTIIDTETKHFARAEYKTDSKTGTTISNQFQDCTDYMKAEATNLSRADIKGTFPTGAINKEANATVTEALKEYSAASNNVSSDEMPTTGSDQTSYSLIDLRALDYDDERWDDLLNQISVSDMNAVINEGAYNTQEIKSIGKPSTHDLDGPQGFSSLMGSTGNAAYCSETLMAQTWNVELMYDLGVCVGEEALASGYNGWYAPAMNIHRSPFAGRNFEYYSEDPYLSGKVGAAVVSGMASKGCYCMVKHFALNDQETRRIEHLLVWANEQAIREIYLRPFEITVKEATVDIKYISDTEGNISTRKMDGCTGIMSSFNYVGTEWAGGRKSLMTNVLRNEWGFRGMVITDFNLYSYMSHDQGIRAGSDLMLTYKMFGGKSLEDTTSATAVKAMRNATHNILFTVVNSNAMQGTAPGSVFIYHLAVWQIVLYIVSAALGAAVIAMTIYVIWRCHKTKEPDHYIDENNIG